LLSGRVNAFLSSQALFATGATLLAASTTPHEPEIIFLACVAVTFSVFSSLAITINCRVINEWHRYIQEAIKQDAKTEYLKGIYMPRAQPDWMHHISTDMFSIFLTVIGGLAWTFIICKELALFPLDVAAAIIVACWLSFLFYIFFKSKIPVD
jgi:hypothetical protein